MWEYTTVLESYQSKVRKLFESSPEHSVIETPLPAIRQFILHGNSRLILGFKPFVNSFCMGTPVSYLDLYDMESGFKIRLVLPKNLKS